MITIDAAILARAMKSAAGIVASTQTLPILGNVRLVAQGETLEITTSDLDTEFRQTVPLRGPGELETTVDARRLAAIAAAAADGAMIMLDMTEHRLTVKTGRSRWQLPVMGVDHFPAMPVDELCDPLTVAAPFLAETLNRLLWAASSEITLPWYCGVGLSNEAGKLCLMCADGIVGVAFVSELAFPKGANDIIVPSKYAATLKQLCGNTEGDLTLEWDTRKIRATFADIVLTGKLIDYQYPAVRKVIAKMEEAKAEDSAIIVDPAGLKAALRRIELVADTRKRGVHFDCTVDALTVSMSAPDTGNASEDIPAESAQPRKAEFNSRQLANLIEAIGGDTIELHHVSPGGNVLIHRTVPDGMLGAVATYKV